MSSFNNLVNLTVQDWNNFDMAVKNTPIIVPTIVGLGNAQKQNYKIAINSKNRVLVENNQITNPKVRTFEANVGNLYTVGSAEFEYKGYTKHWLIQENADVYDANKFNFAVSSSISNLNIAYEKDSYNGDGINKGLISDVVAGSFTYTNGDTLVQLFLAKKNKFVADNNLRASDLVYVMVGGTIYDDLNLPCFNGNKLVSNALRDAGISVIFTPTYLNAGNRVDFVNFNDLVAMYGLEPSVISQLEVISQLGAINKTAQLFTGYQAVGIYKRLPSTVQSYVK